MTRWEYRILESSGAGPRPSVKDLNAAGQEGWEAVAVIGDSYRDVLMKRPVMAADDFPRT